MAKVEALIEAGCAGAERGMPIACLKRMAYEYANGSADKAKQLLRAHSTRVEYDSEEVERVLRREEERRLQARLAEARAANEARLERMRHPGARTIVSWCRVRSRLKKGKKDALATLAIGDAKKMVLVLDPRKKKKAPPRPAAAAPDYFFADAEKIAAGASDIDKEAAMASLEQEHEDELDVAGEMLWDAEMGV